MSSYISTIAKRVGDAADFVHRAAAPVDNDGAEPVPSFFKHALDEIHNQIVRGKPFSVTDLPTYVDAAKNLNGIGIDDRKFLLEKILVLMSRLPEDSQFSKSLQDAVIDILYKDLPHPPASYLSLPAPLSPASCCTPQPIVRYAARSADGSGYNPLFPGMGKTRSPYARTVPSTRMTSRQALPDAGLVFDTLLRRAPSSTAQTAPSTGGNADRTAQLAGAAGADAAADAGFVPHPGGISSLFFAFANLIIHSIFDTDHADWTQNNASSYLDLSPLYGSRDEDAACLRRGDGTGRLWEDVFADARLLLMPPNVCALLVLFCRNHNFVAAKLLAINEAGTYADPSVLPAGCVTLRAQDDEIFARARLVNCGFFMQVILRDYVGAILGLARDGLRWRLDPLSATRESDHEVSPRGRGNTCSVEFNLLYRWHAALSEPDTQYVESTFTELFDGKDFSDITVQDFGKVAREKLRPDPDFRTWTFGSSSGAKLQRDPQTGGFRDADLAEILQNATAASASAFKARGIPAALRVVEVMGIEQSRSWGVCSMNEFRKFMGLRPYKSFKEWNPDPSIHMAAETLYEHIDNLELHVGLQAEEAKPAIPGSGLCPGYTISRAILADAVSLTRGDRFLTTEFTTFNLTSWGYQYCFPDTNDGSYGGMLTRLLFRTLPDYYPPGSAYAHFPFLVPSMAQEYLSRLPESPVAKYTFTRPLLPQAALIVEAPGAVRAVLGDVGTFAPAHAERLAALTKGAKINMQLVDNILSSPEEIRRLSSILVKTTGQLIQEKSADHAGRPFKYVDIVKDVINLIPIRFISAQLAGIPIKTPSTPRGAYPEKQLYEMFSDVCDYVYLNDDPSKAWVLHGKSAATTEVMVDLIYQHLHKISSGIFSLGALSDTVIHWVTGENNESHEFLKRVSTGSKDKKLQDLASSVFAAVVATAALYSKAIVHVVDFYLDKGRQAARNDIISLAGSDNPKSDAKLMEYVHEALCLNPPIPIVMRKATAPATLPDGQKVNQDQNVHCSLATSLKDAPLHQSFVLIPHTTTNDNHRQPGLSGVAEHGLLNSRFFESTIPQILRVIFSLKNLQRAPGQSGRLNRITRTSHGLSEQVYVDFQGRVTPWPASLVVQYEP